MTYRSPLEEAPANLKRTLLGTFDFRGRSTRTELLTFVVVGQIASSLIGLLLVSLVPGLDFGARHPILNGVSVICYLPALALLARRLHDQDRSGWWALLLVIASVALISISRAWSIKGLAIGETQDPRWRILASAVVIIAVWTISLWPPSEGANRFGPNPRLDPEHADQ